VCGCARLPLGSSPRTTYDAQWDHYTGAKISLGIGAVLALLSFKLSDTSFKYNTWYPLTAAGSAEHVGGDRLADVHSVGLCGGAEETAMG
jgi:hypothetical protein